MRPNIDTVKLNSETGPGAINYCVREAENAEQKAVEIREKIKFFQGRKLNVPEEFTKELTSYEGLARHWRDAEQELRSEVEGVAQKRK